MDYEAATTVAAYPIVRTADGKYEYTDCSSYSIYVEEISMAASPIAKTPPAATRRRTTKDAALSAALTDPEATTTFKVPEAKCWQDAELVITSGMDRVLLHGIPGTGKTHAGLHFQRQGSAPGVRNIYLGEETAAYQIVGTDKIEDGTQVWRDGPGLQAWRTGDRLLINEIDHASGDALDALIWICDDKSTAERGVSISTGETVFPHELRQIVATMNGEPEDLGDALSDRFMCRVRITCPHPKAIEALPTHLWEIAFKLTREETPASQRISIRQFRAFAEMIRLGVPSATASRSAFHHRADELLKTITLAAAKSS